MDEPLGKGLSCCGPGAVSRYDVHITTGIGQRSTDFFCPHIGSGVIAIVDVHDAQATTGARGLRPGADRVAVRHTERHTTAISPSATGVASGSGTSAPWLKDSFTARASAAARRVS